MTESYNGFLIRSGFEPLSEMLLGRTTQWHATAMISYVRSNQSVVELTRLRLACMNSTIKTSRIGSGSIWRGSALIRATESW